MGIRGKLKQGSRQTGAALSSVVTVKLNSVGIK
jgi:hypothetical protein